jgi:transcription antitermination factor NusG
MEAGWYAVYTKFKFEAKVANRLSEAGIENFLPTIRILRQRSDRKKWIDKPLFTSYVFVKANAKSYETIRRIPGVVNFVCQINKPARIRDLEIESIRSFLDQVKHETIELRNNDEVLVHSGILAGTKGIIERIEKKYIRLKIGVLKICFFAEIDRELIRKIST